MRALMKRFLLDESGGEMPEYAVVVGLIIVVGASIFLLIGQNLDTIFTYLNELLGDAAEQAAAAQPQ